MKLRQIFRLTLVNAMLLVASTPMHAQDLLAKQAPVDHRMRAVDTLSLKTVIEREVAENPSAQLYNNSWDTKVTHKVTALPDSFRIDLRHFAMPTTHRVVTSKMGPRWGRMHKGLDIKVYIGDTIYAAFDGKVRIKKYEAAGYGKYLVLRHPNGLETVYGHMSDWLVNENQTVKAGQPIGLGGNTGRSTGSHLHFETRLCGEALNPALMFDFVAQDVTGDYYVYRKSTYSRESEVRNNTMKMSGKAVASKDKKTNEQSVAQAPKAEVKQKEQPAPQFSDPRYHKVAAGETLATIAKRRGITVDQLCKLNNLDKSVKVRPGMILRYS